jgi:hypothetical protein
VLPYTSFLAPNPDKPEPKKNITTKTRRDTPFLKAPAAKHEEKISRKLSCFRVFVLCGVRLEKMRGYLKNFLPEKAQILLITD